MVSGRPLKRRTAKRGLQGVCCVCGEGVYADEFGWSTNLASSYVVSHRGECQRLLQASSKVALGWLKCQRGRPAGRRLVQKEALDL